MTFIEKLVQEHDAYKQLGNDASRGARQTVLDRITDDIMRFVTPFDIFWDTQAVYGATIEDYAANPHTKDIVDELLEFMAILPDGARVLDIGCGTGRDALFMSVRDQEFRSSLMGRTRKGIATRDVYSIPQKVFSVTALDQTPAMIAHAIQKKRELVLRGLLDEAKHNPRFLITDMHVLKPEVVGMFDGAWSCTALFTHTPREWIHSSLRGVASVLATGGIFFVSYTNGKADGRYDKLLLSSTGRIKYFSQPDPDEITARAKEAGLTLSSETYNDHIVNGTILKKNLYASQLFVKE